MSIPVPESLKKPLEVPKKLLMGPGPSNCPPRVLHALAEPILGHMHPEVFKVSKVVFVVLSSSGRFFLLKIMDDVKDGIRYVFQTKNPLTLAVSASGHAGMEAVLCNLLEPGETVLVGVNGIWGERAIDSANRYKANVKKIEAIPGESFTLAQIEQAVSQFRPALLFLVQGESSTGVLQNIKGVGDICRRFGCLLAVDTVASLGGTSFLADEWKVDAVYTGSQKVLGAPAGITPISFSPRAQYDLFLNKLNYFSQAIARKEDFVRDRLI